MAALIDGYTIHHWSGMPACTTAEGGNGFGDSRKLSTKCQSLRVIIIDELSMVSAELFGALEYVVKKVIRSQHTYKNDLMGARALLEESTSLPVWTGGSYLQSAAHPCVAILRKYRRD